MQRASRVYSSLETPWLLEGTLEQALKSSLVVSSEMSFLPTASQTISHKFSHPFSPLLSAVMWFFFGDFWCCSPGGRKNAKKWGSQFADHQNEVDPNRWPANRLRIHKTHDSPGMPRICYCWEGTNPANQLRLAVNLIIHKVLYIPDGFLFAGFPRNRVCEKMWRKCLLESWGPRPSKSSINFRRRTDYIVQCRKYIGLLSSDRLSFTSNTSM